MPFVGERSIVERKEDVVDGRGYLHGPHKEDNEIQLLSVTAKGHEELYRPGAFTLILPVWVVEIGMMLMFI